LLSNSSYSLSLAAKLEASESKRLEHSFVLNPRPLENSSFRIRFSENILMFSLIEIASHV